MASEGAAYSALRALPRHVTDTLTVRQEQEAFDLLEESRRAGVGYLAFKGKMQLLERPPCSGEVFESGELFALPT